MGGNNKKKNKNRNKKRKHAKQISSNEQLSEDKPQHTGEDNLSQDEGDFDSLINAKKRQHNDNDSDHEEKPRKKKKKKQPVVVDTSDNKKGKKSIRQMKRERYAERQAEAQALAKDQLKSQCLNYLSQWKHDKQNWKFMKAKQVWLFKNKFSSTLVPDSTWPLLLEYFESAQGNIRKILLDDANKIIKQMDEWTESQTGEQQLKEESDDENENTEDNEESSKHKKPDENVYKRARDLIQCLEEYTFV